MGSVNISGSDYLALSYLQVLFNTDITCTVQVSGDLTTWSSGSVLHCGGFDGG